MFGGQLEIKRMQAIANSSVEEINEETCHLKMWS